MRRFVSLLCATVFSLVPVFDGRAQKPALNIAYETLTLKNGLTVVLHDDRSDPIVAVAIVYHVGSNREIPGRTGFAHLFEHIMFQESQNVGQDQLFKKIQDAGGTLNGFTTFDATTYYEVVPKNALEMALWLESDRMGYLLSALDRTAFENQQEVVRNEKRQSYDNVPYGHTSYVIHKALYPADHPYNWQVIGALDDLKHATLEDVKAFFTKWYGPNNATLVIAGDFDRDQTQQWVEKYFGEIKTSSPVRDRGPVPVTLGTTKRYAHEDNFANAPELNMVFPTVPNYRKDAYALNMLANLMGDGKKAPLFKVLVEEKKLAPSVSVFQSSEEIDGYLRIRVRAFPDIHLTDVERTIKEAFARFETDGFTDQDLRRIKARIETSFYNGLTSVLNKAFQLGFYAEYAGSPGFVTQDLQQSLDVTREDILRVYGQYVKDKPYVLTSFVPKGQTTLIAEHSETYPVVEEPIVALSGAPEKVAKEPVSVPLDKIPSSFDRSKEPPKGPAFELRQPVVWQEKLANGMKVLGIEQHEVPLVQFSMTIQGGLLLDDPNKIGAANLLANLLMEGTKSRTPVALEEAIADLGSSITMAASKTAITIRVNTLASKFDETYALFEEMLLQPRWDEKAFTRIKSETRETIKRQQANPSAIANNVFEKLVYGGRHILGNTTLGSTASIDELSIDDVKRYYDRHFSPSVTHLAITGDITQDRAMKAVKAMEIKWPAKPVSFPIYETPERLDNPALYFVDSPSAKQSQIRIGYLSLAQTDPDYHALLVMNYRLGGSFNGVLNLILREEKGYTYGARSGFSGTRYPGPFTASSAVRSNATFESMKIFKDELNRYSTEMITAEDLAFTKNAMIQSDARRFETYNALIGMLDELVLYDRPLDYVNQEQAIARNMKPWKHFELAVGYINPRNMVYLVVGDARTQMEPLRELGLGEPVLLNANGQPTTVP